MIPAGEVHVWRAWLDVSADLLGELEASLSPDERERAARFRFAKDRDRFVAARGILRDILARYLGVNAAALRFRYGAAGKPALEDSSELRFNASHSHGFALYAVTMEKDVGIDVELIRPRVAEERIAERFFRPSEAASLRALPQEKQAEAFFRIWTRKEAYIKAVGTGLSMPLDSFDPAEVPGWPVRDLDSDPRYRAALAVEGEGWSLREFEWEPGKFHFPR